LLYKLFKKKCFISTTTIFAPTLGKLAVFQIKSSQDIKKFSQVKTAVLKNFPSQVKASLT